MRKTLLMLALAGMITLPVVAQFRPGAGMFGGGQNLLSMKEVRKELKFTDDQNKVVADLQEKNKEATSGLRELFAEDREKAMAQMKKAGDDLSAGYKKLRGDLTSAQKKRLGELEIQNAAKNKDLGIFKNEDALKVLKLTDKQKEELKEVADTLEKDSKELLDDAKGDKKKGREVFGKIRTMNAEAFDKVMKGLDDDQKKAWEAAQGEKFEFPEFGFGKEKGKGKKDKRKKKEEA
ncbi:MAG: hypothetical protein K2W96_06255 [Gemmataceae bacterium]|nr:hypothetical protein [Gemmataceae bacterium]